MIPVPWKENKVHVDPHQNRNVQMPALPKRIPYEQFYAGTFSLPYNISEVQTVSS